MVRAEDLRTRALCPLWTNFNQKQGKVHDPRREIFLKSVSIMCAWLGRRGAHCTWLAMNKSLVYDMARNPKVMTPGFSNMIKGFYNEVYKDMVDPIVNQPVVFDLNKRDIQVTIPLIDEYDKKYHIMFFEATDNTSLFLKMVPIRTATIWATMALGDNVVLHNFNISKNQLNHIVIPITPNYYDSCRKIISNMLESRAYTYPTEEICKICPHLGYCPA